MRVLLIGLTNQILVGIAASVIAAVLFLFLILIFLAPSIKISRYIVKRDGVIPRGESPIVFVFKFVNKSFFPAFDIMIELFEIEKVPVAEGKMNIRFTNVNMAMDTIKYVHGYWYFGEINRVGNYAVLPKTYEDLEQHMNNEHVYLQLQVTAKHGLTGLSRVFKKDFVVKDHCVKQGVHQHGRRRGIVQ